MPKECASKISFYEPRIKYTKPLIERVKRLDTKSAVIFDAEGTVISREKTVRSDFHEAYHWIKENRPDLQIGILTYRSNTTGVPELNDYELSGTWFREDVLETVGKPDKVEFLDRVFEDKEKLLFVDNSPEGLKAEELGFGMKVA